LRKKEDRKEGRRYEYERNVEGEGGIKIRNK
jgi:hypothetical protein